MSDDHSSHSEQAPAEHTLDEAGTSVTSSPSARGDWLPVWAPWAVLGGLLLLGLLGGLGLVPMKGPTAAAAASAPAAHAPLAVKPGASAASAPSAAADEVWFSAAHVLISHRNTPIAQKHGITRTKEEARQRALEVMARARKGDDFTSLVLEYSDEPRIQESKGVLIRFRQRDAVKPFGDAVAALKIGAISDVVESNFGFHVIKRLPLGQKPSAPTPTPAQ